jgi:hypothetical protein
LGLKGLVLTTREKKKRIVFAFMLKMGKSAGDEKCLGPPDILHQMDAVGF